MRLITVLNRCTTFKRFVFEGSHFDRHGRIMVRIRPRKNSGARAAAAVTWPPPTELEQEHRRKQEAAGEQEPSRFLDQIAVICSDIWKAYLNVISKRLPAAVPILDRFHIMQHFSKALDKVRADTPRGQRSFSSAGVSVR